MNLKTLSTIIVLAAALAASAQNSKDKKTPSKPAPHHTASSSGSKSTTPKPPAPSSSGSKSSSSTSSAGKSTSPSKPVSSSAGQSSSNGSSGQKTTTGGAQTKPHSFTRTSTHTSSTTHTTGAAGSTIGHGKVAVGTPVKTAVGTFTVGHSSKPGAAVVFGKTAPPKTSFKDPAKPVSSNNYPPPHSGNTYITNNTTIINNNYRYDSSHYQPHVANFYGHDDAAWGGHWRYGCFAPASGVSVSFGFGFYAYTPYYAAVVASPWYYYPCVPAYIPQSRVVFLSGYSCDWRLGAVYTYQPGIAYNTYGDYALNHAVDLIAEVYQKNNVNYANGLMDPNFPVSIFSEGNYEYTLNSNDFHQTLADNLAATQTESFTITGVRNRGDHGVVYATHVFSTPNGGTETVYQAYHMARYGGHFVITDFMTSHAPFDM